MPRIMFRRWINAVAVIILSCESGDAFAADNWDFTATDIEIAYRYQQNFGSRLKQPIKPQDCYYGKSQFVASYQGQTFLAPCEFIHHTRQHLRMILENGSARYIFPLDADHAHLAVPKVLWRQSYSQLDARELLPRILAEPALIALYHTAEHLMPADLSNSPVSRQINEWKSKRNVLAFYDGRPIEVLPPNADGSGHERVENYQTVITVFFLAHRHGALTVSASGTAHAFDLSFDDDLAE